MAVQVDARGLSCPEPVLKAKKAVQAGEFPIDVLVDTATSVQNVERMARKAGLKYSTLEAGDHFVITLTQ